MHIITNIFTKDENAFHNGMRMIESELVPVYETSSGEKVVYGTELHFGLGSPSAYREWSKRRFDDVDAVENEDYTTVEIPTVSGGLPKKDHIIRLDTAKEMAMLERNEKGKQVRRYFIRVEQKYKDHIKEVGSEPLLLCLKGIKFIADDLKVAQSSRLLMYNGAFEEFGLPTSFLPKYEDNGSRERCSATELLKRNNCGIGAAKFNEKLMQHGYLEIKERPSSKGGKKLYKSLTDDGLRYGVNLINEKNQKEVQPYYYADTFMDLFNIVNS